MHSIHLSSQLFLSSMSTHSRERGRADMSDLRAWAGDSFLLDYQPSELRIASEFLTNWLPFLSRDLCHSCTRVLSDRIRSLAPEIEGDAEPTHSAPSTPINVEVPDHDDSSDAHSLGSWKGGAEEINILDTWKHGVNGCSDPVTNASTSETSSEPASGESSRVRMSWADMAQEDDELEEEQEVNKQLAGSNSLREEVGGVAKAQQKTQLSRDQREYIRFMNVIRKKDFICLERFKGKIVNILDGLELHSGIFSAAEQKRIVDYIYELQEMGKNGKLKSRTYAAPQKWMRGKGRVTIQFGCCYNYATDKNGNPPGILQTEIVDPLPNLFKVIIRRLVRWHVLPPSCVPDSCIVNIYEEGDCIPPHIDNHDFVRPFCTVSFLSECNIVFGTNLKAVAAGEFTGSFPISLPVGSVLVLNGNGADVAKHCVPAVPAKRISITFRKMDESKRPVGFVPEPDLQGLQPLSYEENKSRRPNPPNSPRRGNRRAAGRRERNAEEVRRIVESRSRRGPPRQRIRVNLG
ncbi:RNA demethylase ALKBH9B [Malania oleifera]|uniref:RNA demethylase ALKBH9B n=1 Tax=Malania oleifera TaxID=397392 RepID=UPI0025ADA025|nr:RNA demethylase ALKBH9B [Malania oleifera]